MIIFLSLNPVKSILVTQPQPKDNNSPFPRLAEKYELKVDFIPFIKIDPVCIKDFRKQKIISQVQLNIPTYTKDNLPEDLLKIQAVKPGSRTL